jgi:preprotein translocase subunit SecD
VVNQVLSAVFTGVFLALGTWGYLRRPRRGPFWFGAVCAAAAAASAYYDAFWPMVCLGVLTLWACIGGLKVVDLNWRVRFGLVLGLVIVAFFSLWPSLNAMTSGKFPCPHYIKEHVGFRLVAGLDLRGGLRLVYTVDVDEAIKDKRDRYYEEMQAMLAKAYGLHDGDGRPSEAPAVARASRLRSAPQARQPDHHHLQEPG